MRLMLRYMAPYKRAVAIGLTVKTLSTLLELLLPSILSYILDYVVPLHRVIPILMWGLLMVLAATGAFFGNVFANRNDHNKFRPFFPLLQISLHIVKQ